MSSTARPLALAFACLLGLGLGLACKSGGGSNAPGQVTAVEGGPACPRSVPAKGAPCPRGEAEFCVYRTTGETDYMLQAMVPDVAGYDRLYKRLIARVPLTDVSSFFVMEKVKETTELPLDYAG